MPQVEQKSMRYMCVISDINLRVNTGKNQTCRPEEVEELSVKSHLCLNFELQEVGA